MNQTTLFRYNFRVLMTNNWLLLVFPLAVSQLTVFWYVLTRKFTLELPAQSVEMVTPLLAAFLGAHLLSAEYRSRIGAVLASRPVNIARIVVLRLIVMLALVWTLAGLSLMAYTFWMQPFELAPPLLACIPSTLFLTMLALTFATLFRHSLTGFAVAALYWALDLIPGAPLQPYLSLRSLTSYYAVMNNPYRQIFLESWWVAKAILLVAALALYLYHARLVFTLGSPYTMRIRRRASLGVGALLVFYLLSGAVLKVGYGYTHRGRLPPSDLAWFRYQFASYGPLPVARLFGPTFARYLGDFANPLRLSDGEEQDQLGDTVKHRVEMQEILDKNPDSLWAPSAADAVARWKGQGDKNLDGKVATYRYVVVRYPQSPYIEFAVRQIARTYDDAERPAEACAAYEEMLQRAPHGVYRSEAYRFLFEMDQKANHLPEAAQWAEKWTAVAAVHERFEAWMDLATVRKAIGDIPGAKQAAQAMLKGIDDYKQAQADNKLNLTPSQINFRNEAIGRALALAKTLNAD